MLDAVGAPGVALAIWQRHGMRELAALTAAIDLDDVDDIAITIDCPVRAEVLAAALVAAGYAEAAASALAADIGMLAARLVAHDRPARLKLRLEVVETDACHRFHADYVTLRLLSTYRGQGTQWHRAAAPDGVAQMAAGDVAIFKGRVLLDPPPVLHRSPPIAQTGESRLLLVLDPVAAG